MAYRVDLQNVASCDSSDIPDEFTIQRWVKAVLQDQLDAAEVTIRIVDSDEIQDLNNRYRKKNQPTNVLSFPFEMPESVELRQRLLGDIIVCADIVKQEAAEQHKLLRAHWAHMIIHGLLHLLGYDHIEDQQAIEMESLEIDLLHSLGFANPYITVADANAQQHNENEG